MTELRLAMLGCGGIAAAYRSALRELAGVRLAAVVDPDPAARERLVDGDGSIASCASIAELPDVELALVLTPPNTHEALSITLLQRGTHVLCEKPLAPSLAAAERMHAAAHAVRRHLMMGSKFRYTPDVTAARGLLDRGICGDVVMYENVFCSHVDMTRRWNARAEVSGGGVLIDNGCHSVDLARFLLGPLARVQAQFGRRAQEIAVEDTARLLFETHDGAIGAVDLSWSVHKQTDAYVRIFGTRGTIEIGWNASRFRSAESQWQTFGQGYDKVGAFREQLRNFVAVVRGEATPVIGADDALASVRVIECAYRSAHEARWVTTP